MLSDFTDTPASSCTRLETRLAGVLSDGRPVLAHALFVADEGAVALQLDVRAPDPSLADLVLASI